MTKPKSEKVIIFQVYKQNGQVFALPSDNDTNSFEILGFLDSYVQYLKECILSEMIENENK